MIDVKNLVKRYGPHTAVDDISFNIDEGEIVGFLGPNGAGKSTTMNIITGYLSSSSGACKVDGFDILEEPNEVKKRIGYLPEQPPLYLEMTVREYLDFVYDIKKCTLPRKEHIAEICKMVRIENYYTRRIQSLSKGYRQRVGIAQALINNPKVIILDEPTVGLDPEQIIEIRSLIRQLGKQHTIILSSHILQEIEAVCNRVVIINKGRLVADGKISELTAQYSKDLRIVIQVAGAENDVLALLRKIPDVDSVSTLGEKEKGVFAFSVEPKHNADDIRREINKRLAASNYPIMELTSRKMTLEDVFISLTKAGQPPKKSSKGGNK